MLAGDTRAEAWLLPLLQQRGTAPNGTQLLAAGPQAPGPVPVRDVQVCGCFDVGRARIRLTLNRCPGDVNQRLAALQAELKCGTQCGSCLPELRRLAQEQVAQGVAV
jgi:assimilatory nitrate reductase catalytic subunit